MIRKIIVQFLSAVLILLTVCTVSAAENSAASTLKAVISADAESNNSIVTISGETTANYLQLIVIKPLSDFSDITFETFDDVVYYTDTLTVAEGNFSCSLFVPETEGNGRYMVKAVFNEASGCEEVITSFYKTSEDYAKELVAAYVNTDANGFSQVFSKYCDVYDVEDVFATEIQSLLNTDADKISESFVMARDGYVNHTFTETPETVSEIKHITEILKCALMLYHLNYSDDFNEYLENYRETMPLVFDDNFDADEFPEIYKLVREEDAVTTDDEAVLAIQKALGLSMILDGSNQEKADALKQYSKGLGLSEETLKNSGFTLLEIAKYLEEDKAAVKSYVSNLSDTVDGVIKSLKEKESEGTSRPAGGGGGGGGVSGGRGDSSINVGNREDSNKEESKPTVTPVCPFTDLVNYPWATGAITSLYGKNIINGKSETTFAPGADLTREEAVKLFISAFGLEETQKDLRFADVTVSDWFYPYVAIAVENGIVKGLSSTEFGVGVEISRQDFAVMLRRTLKVYGVRLTTANAVSFADSEEISEYAKSDIDALSANGLFNGDDIGNFNPKANITRAEAATAIYRAIAYCENHQEVQ